MAMITPTAHPFCCPLSQFGLTGKVGAALASGLGLSVEGAADATLKALVYSGALLYVFR